MITFKTQEDFEQAVMDILSARLGISVSVGNSGYYDDGKKIEVELYDRDGCVTFDSDSDSLPTPKINY